MGLREHIKAGVPIVLIWPDLSSPIAPEWSWLVGKQLVWLTGGWAQDPGAPAHALEVESISGDGPWRFKDGGRIELAEPRDAEIILEGRERSLGFDRQIAMVRFWVGDDIADAIQEDSG